LGIQPQKEGHLDIKLPRQDLSPPVILLIGVFVTGIACLESWNGWFYAPFPIIHVLLALLIPIWYGGLHLKNPWLQLYTHRRLFVILAGSAILFIGGYILLYSLFLNLLGRTGDANWNIIATYKVLSRLYIARYNQPTVFIVGYLLVGVWPMFGEEFFYRGFLFKGLKSHTSPTVAAIISSSLFGLRHALQLVYLWPSYPLAAGIAYFLWAAGFGLIWDWAYHRSQSLWPCIATHAANLILAPIVFAIILRS